MKTKPISAVETPLPGEDAVIAKIVKALADKYRRDNAGNSGLFKRAFHAKSHGLVRGKFIVSPTLPDEIAGCGLFQPGASYDCWLRFSNGNPKSGSDRSMDVRAVAIKAEGVSGKRVLPSACDADGQDFILANHPTLFIRNPADFLAFLQHPALFMAGLKPFAWGPRLHEAHNLLACLMRTAHSPLGIRYWSQSPYRLGRYAVKYSLKPRNSYKGAVVEPTARGPNFLREAMVAHLSGNGMCVLELSAQFQTDARRMPIEDTTVEWDEQVSPFIPVAAIRIEAQDFDNVERDRIGENLSFSPWHSLPEHAPLGGINRARRAVYEHMFALRQQLNQG